MIPSFFAIILIKTLWINGVMGQDNEWFTPPTPLVVSQIETSLKQCELDADKWEIAGQMADKSKFTINMGVAKCYVIGIGTEGA